MTRIPLTDAKNDLSAVIRKAETNEVLITRHGRPAAVLIAFHDEDDWLEYRLLNDKRFLKTVEDARANIRAGKFTRLEDLTD